MTILYCTEIVQIYALGHSQNQFFCDFKLANAPVYNHPSQYFLTDFVFFYFNSINKVSLVLIYLYNNQFSD